MRREAVLIITGQSNTLSSRGLCARSKSEETNAGCEEVNDVANERPIARRSSNVMWYHCCESSQFAHLGRLSRSKWLRCNQKRHEWILGVYTEGRVCTASMLLTCTERMTTGYGSTLGFASAADEGLRVASSKGESSLGLSARGPGSVWRISLGM